MTPYFQKFLVLCQAYCVVIDVIFTAIARLLNKPAGADEKAKAAKGVLP